MNSEEYSLLQSALRETSKGHSQVKQICNGRQLALRVNWIDLKISIFQALYDHYRE